MFARMFIWLLALLFVSLPAYSQTSSRTADDLSYAALDALDAVSHLMQDLRAQPAGDADLVVSGREATGLELEEELRTISATNTNEPGWEERAQRRISKLLVGLERMRLDSERSGLPIPDTTAVEAAMAELANVVSPTREVSK